MTELSIPQKLVRLTRKCVEGSNSVVRVGNALSTSFLINTGLKQRDAMSQRDTLLFVTLFWKRQCDQPALICKCL